METFTSSVLRHVLFFACPSHSNSECAIQTRPTQLETQFFVTMVQNGPRSAAVSASYGCRKKVMKFIVIRVWKFGKPRFKLLCTNAGLLDHGAVLMQIRGGLVILHNILENTIGKKLHEFCLRAGKAVNAHPESLHLSLARLKCLALLLSSASKMDYGD